MRGKSESEKNFSKKISHKKMINFLSKTKKQAKNQNIPFDMRLENYTNKDSSNYTYGIR